MSHGEIVDHGLYSDLMHWKQDSTRIRSFYYYFLGHSTIDQHQTNEIGNVQEYT